jgi:uncharacterized membrane protein
MKRAYSLCVLPALLALVPLSGGISSTAAEPSLRALDFQPLATSADGTVIVGDRAGEAVRWTASGGTVPLGFPAYQTSAATGVSGDGSVVVGVFQDGIPLQFRWTATTGVTRLGPVPFFSFRPRVSADGRVIIGDTAIPKEGYGLYNYNTEAYRWTDSGGGVGLGRPAGSDGYSTAKGVSADGSVVVGWEGQTVYGTPPDISIYFPIRPFRWTADTGRVRLGLLPGDDAYRDSQAGATGVSADGSVVVGFSSGFDQAQAVRWTIDGGVTGLGRLPGHIASVATAVSGDGNTVVGTSMRPFPEQEGEFNGPIPFVWDEAHGMRSLGEVLSGLSVDISGWILDEYYTPVISADGSTVIGSSGYGGWVATIPEPAALPLLALAGCATVATCHARRRHDATGRVALERRGTPRTTVR